MKLNYKRTLLVGFAFFLICAFWQAYDAIVPLMLVNKFGLDQTWSGVIMSLDNVLALFMLPLFGALSDKHDTRFGKRTPFIVIGTLCAVLCFVGLTVSDNAQLFNMQASYNGEESTLREQLWDSNYEVSNSEYNNITNNQVDKTFHIQDYSARILYNKDFKDLTTEEQTAVENWYKDTLTQKMVYSYSKDGGYRNFDNKDAANEALAKNTKATYSNVVNAARSSYAWGVTSANPAPLIFFIVILLLVLIGMATFRSPAVALMPDVTIKPLRSKANAIINLMGAVGGILVLGLGMLFKTSDIKNQVMSYTWYVIAVCVIMLVSLAIFVFTVKEKKWNKEMLLSQQEFDEANPDPVEDNVIINAKGEEKLPKDKLKSLIFILASVAFWFIGYNAITSKYSLYAINILQKDFNVTLLVAQAAAIISYIPIGFIASKLGRKKCILIGIGLLTTAFGGAIFVNSATPDIVIYLLFALAGIAWATINVNSFPMVVELSQGGNIGKYTGYYYTASMAAQVLTPILSGFLMDTMGSMSILFPYGATFVALSFVTMLFVKHGDSKPIKKNNLEALSGPED